MKRRLRDIPGNCSVCEVEIHGGYFCWQCYTMHKHDILSKMEWTRFLVNEENKRRRKLRLAHELNIRFVYLGDDWDVTTEGKLVRREGYYSG